jgi:hypothetical protein
MLWNGSSWTDNAVTGSDNRMFVSMTATATRIEIYASGATGYGSTDILKRFISFDGSTWLSGTVLDSTAFQPWSETLGELSANPNTGGHGTIYPKVPDGYSGSVLVGINDYWYSTVLLVHVLAVPVGQATETDSAGAVTHPKFIVLSQSAETDSALAVAVGHGNGFRTATDRGGPNHPGGRDADRRGRNHAHGFRRCRTAHAPDDFR